MMSFDNTEIAFKDKSSKELKKTLWLFRLVGNPGLVKTGSYALKAALFLKLPVRWAIKPTVFDHFCGGETIDECDETISKLGKSGIQTILDYSAEGKESEEDFEYTKNQILATIEKAKNNPHIPYAVFKPSGLASVALLEKAQNNEELSEKEQQEFDRIKQRVETICAKAKETGVPVMVDAEESWIQQIVDEMVEEMKFKYNKEKPLIFGTLQMYRHDRLEYLKDFVKRAREKGIFTAFKLVRGAYMEKERARAKKLGLPSPIYPDKPATDQGFDEATLFCLENIRDVAVCVGTHNENSCALAAETMKKSDIRADHPHVSFAQLLGMSDHISYNLAASGFNVCKYVPYGPVKTVVPYLIRRAEENTSVAGQTSRELFLLKKEAVRRKVEQ